MSNRLKGLTDDKGNAYNSNDKVQNHAHGWSVNGNGSCSEAEARAKLIANSKK